MAGARPSPAYAEIQREVRTLGWTPEAIRLANRDDLLTMQHRLGMGCTWGCWEIPKSFLPPGSLQQDGARIFNLNRFLPSDYDEESQNALIAWSEILRFAISRCVFPLSKVNIVAPSTLAADLVSLKQVIPKIIVELNGIGKFWSLINDGEVMPHRKEKHRAPLIAAVQAAHSIGSLPDMFSSAPTINGIEPERRRKGTPLDITIPEVDRVFQPFPDDFISEIGWRSLSVIQKFGPTLIASLEMALAAPVKRQKNGNLYSAGSQQARMGNRMARDGVISNWKWLDETNEPLHSLEFDFFANSNGVGSKAPLIWPPKTFSQAFEFAHLLVKPANLWAVLIGNGNRQSEVLSLRRDCLYESRDGNFHWKGKTYKMTRTVGGTEVDVIAPNLITRAILLQMRIAHITGIVNSTQEDSLWSGARGDEQRDLSLRLNKYVSSLNIKMLLGDDSSCHTHRFRKSLARLVALALFNAPQILKDVFGHDDVEMTIRRYILSDPSIANEILEIQKELVILKAVEVTGALDSIEGLGAQRLRHRSTEYLKRIGKSKFEPKDSYEFAQRETFNGRSWMVVGPGIICTAPHDLDAGGPCNNGQRGPNPAYCQTGCENQIVESSGRNNADATVSYVLTNLQNAIDDNDDGMMLAHWAGQLRTWLYRHESVAKKWMHHPLVQKYGAPAK